MSYFDESNTGGNDNGYPGTPMLFDVYALQQIYGANMSTRTGDTIYGFGSNAGAVFDFAIDTSPAVCIWDAGGIDTLNCANYSQTELINLNAGTFSNIGGLTANVSIALGATIENAVGGSGADTITGNSANNRLTGGGGADTIDGGQGSDTAVYGGAHTQYQITQLMDGSIRLVDQRGGSPDGTDTDSNIELFQFSDGVFTVSQLIGGGTVPTITSNGAGDAATVVVGENSTAVTTVTATDPDVGTTLTYSLVGGSDQARFQINSATGALSFVSAPNFEAPTDSDGNNSYVVQVRVTDNGGLFDTQTITVNVTNVNEPPTAVALTGATTSIAENTSTASHIKVADIVVTDDSLVAGNTLALTGADAAFFEIVNNALYLRAGTVLDFEARSSYSVAVTVDDPTVGGTPDATSTTFTLNVTNVNEVPTITSNGADDTATVGVAENSTAVTTVTAADPDAGTALTYSLVGGSDQSSFHIDPTTGALSFVDAPNFEAPTDSDGNNSYVVQVRATDNTGLFDTQTITVNVTNVNEVPGDFNRDGHSDILWHSDSGGVALWEMNGPQLQLSTLIGSVGTDWHIDGTGDFNGDENSDILWRNDSGALALWEMNGPQLQLSALVGSVGTDWHIDGTGDFNGDGHSDILWRNDSGAVALWEMNGPQLQLSALVGSVGTDWHIDGTGDFNGDGHSDILWQRTDGTLAIFDMNGPQVQSAQVFGQLGADWRIAAIGDFNGDGTSDILWRRADGTIMMFEMNNNDVQSSQVLGQVGNEWHIF